MDSPGGAPGDPGSLPGNAGDGKLPQHPDRCLARPPDKPPVAASPTKDAMGADVRGGSTFLPQGRPRGSRAGRVRKRRGSDCTPGIVQAGCYRPGAGGRRQSSASRGSAGEFLLRSFYVIAFLELISGIRCREAATSRVRDQMSREGAGGPLGRAGKAEEGQTAEGSGSGSVAGCR